MSKKKEKVEKGFIDYPGKQFQVLDSKRPDLLLLLRRALIDAGAPDFGELTMRKAAVAMKGKDQLLFIEVAQTQVAQRDWITFSIPLQHVASFLGKGTFYLESTATVRHYRQAAKYEIRLPEPLSPGVFKADSLSNA